MTNPRLEALADAGVSIWLDDLNRPMITSGELQGLIDDAGVVGVTTNPTIFAAALSHGAAYDEQVRSLCEGSNSLENVTFEITTEDVRRACDILRPVYDATHGQDGRVSIEVDPRMARDTPGTVDMARRLWQAVDRPNVMIKIPATVQGLPAITHVLSEGINVNVTLIFSLDRYRGVMNAFLVGLEQAREAGRDLSTIHSVASFFVSRVDSEVDRRLDALIAGSDPAVAEAATQLKGRAGIANARLAYQAYQEVFGTPRWENLRDDGGHAQRPLWASTGVKNPHDVRHRARRAEHRQHHADGDLGGDGRPRRDPDGPGHRRLRRGDHRPGRPGTPGGAVSGRRRPPGGGRAGQVRDLVERAAARHRRGSHPGA